MRRLLVCALLLAPTLPCSPVLCQSAAAGCKPLLRFQMLERPTFQARVIDPAKLLFQVAHTTVQPSAVEKLAPANGMQGTLSLLVVVWPDGLSAHSAARLATALGKDHHWRVNLAVLTPDAPLTTWSDDAARQAGMLQAAALPSAGALQPSVVTAAAAHPGQVGATAIRSTASAQVHWQNALREAIQQLRQQPGARVVLEAVPPPAVLPSMDQASGSPGPFPGEAQVRSEASLLPTPVYRVLNSGPALPRDRLDHRGFAAYGDTWQGTGREVHNDGASLGRGLENRIGSEESWIQQSAPVLPPAYRIFAAFGGSDIWSVADVMPTILDDARRMYIVTLPAPASCRSNQLIAMRVQAAGHNFLPQIYFPAFLYPPALGVDTQAASPVASSQAPAATLP